MNNRYTNGKIYQITNNLNDMIYIGSTCLPLRKRWYNHKKDMNNRDMTRPPRRLFQLAEQIGWNEMRIVLIEAYPCNSSDELRRREEFHLKQVPSHLRLNMMQAYTTQAEYDLKHREWSHRYRIKHRDKINAWQRQYQRTDKMRQYKANHEANYKDKRKEHREYRNTWGFRNNCCLLDIDPALFT